jgi:methylated-DNA-protein-cysteine methyltransferase-like protein
MNQENNPSTSRSTLRGEFSGSDSKSSGRGGFFEQVYDLVKQIPVGKVTTYGEIARALGTKDARRIGHALHKNPYEGIVPCHRVVTKLGRLAPNFAFDGEAEQRKRLLAEGVVFIDETHVSLQSCMFSFA